ncbi:cellulose binding domain-containing protein [Plantactinospora siamensis]|uniref:Cellulose binding domain-containing protein n=1 Tax=Plantactinospora siamensis TaxID=555372 RepID=A0ABV6NYW1_9ACTN
MRPIRQKTRLVLSVVATTGLAVTAALTATEPARAATGCRVGYTVTNQWTGGFGASVQLSNLGDPLTSWRLTWSFGAGQTVTQWWNGTVSQSGARVTVDNASYNGNLGTGASTTFGFNGSWNNSANPVPTDFALNGVACTGSTSPSPGGPTPTTTPTSPAPPTTTPPPSTAPPTSAPPTSVLGQVSTAGRVRAVGNGVQYTWPGVYFEGRFRGTGVGIVLNDANNDYVVQVDGATVATLVTPGQTTYWVRNLADGAHTVRLAKRTESPWAAGEFDGLVAAPGGAILAKPAARSRQLEFIGDSWTAGYGNMSTTRDCSGNAGVTRNSNADSSFGALTAKGLNADYQINAWSGLGVVRNYNGGSTDTSFRAYYDTDLQAVWNSTTWQNPGTWKPQVVVIGLGINDFSTALHPGEKWSTVDQLAADYRTAYLGFLDRLRARYGPDTYLVLTYPDMSGTPFADSVEQVVRTRNNSGDARVRSLHYDNTALGLDLLGCDWHPSLHDDQALAGAITRFLGTLPLSW